MDVASARVTSIFIYPVKSCRGFSVSQALLTPTGVDGQQPWKMSYGASDFGICWFQLLLIFRVKPERWIKGEVGSMEIDGKSYNFQQMHRHTPSEHLLDGEQYPLELHLVHKTTKDGKNVAIVAILFTYGDADPLLAKLKRALDEMSKDECGSDEMSQVVVGKLDTKHLKRNSHRYYRYIGSLTNPSCTENVIWTILGKVRSVSKSQVEALKAPLKSAFKNNARPVQPLNDGKIELFDELDK